MYFINCQSRFYRSYIIINSMVVVSEYTVNADMQCYDLVTTVVSNASLIACTENYIYKLFVTERDITFCKPVHSCALNRDVWSA